MRRLGLLVLLAGTALGGCSLIPDYERPALPVAAQFPDGPAYRAETAEPAALTADALGWRDFFRDPALRHLIEIDNHS